ncbi:MAG TPA: hypothetical protein VGD41_16300 [Pyrinomonadaceae bacterium]
MSDSMQTMHGDSQPATAQMADTTQAHAGANGQEANKEPKFKRIKPNELNMLAKFIEQLPNGDPNSTIQFANLPRELKLLVLPMSDARLVERELVELTYDEDTGAIQTVSVNPLAYAGYKRMTEEETSAPSPASAIGGGIRGSRGEFSDPKFKLYKMDSANPHREGTRRWYTWEMYENGDSMDQVRVKPYDRNIKLYTGKWFNGPDRAVIELDIKQGYLWVYDSTQRDTLDNGERNPAYWVSQNPMQQEQAVETLDDQEVTAEA